MRWLSIVAAAAALSLAAMSTLAQPVVEVVFVNPEGYADASPSRYVVDERERDAVLAELREHLRSLGAKYLKHGDRLRIEVLDVDLAGILEVSRSGQRDVRVMREAGTPRIDVRYTLNRGGVQSSGQERITDQAYLDNAMRCRGAGPLCYEKLMLDDWFMRRFAGDAMRRTQ
jgi:hypothetical protein